MINTSSYIAQLLGEIGIIQEEDIDKCRYGLDVGLSTVLELASILIISIFVGNFIQTIIFFTAFIPLRVYSGGYHADTRLRCYFILLAVYMIFSVLIWIIPTDIYSTIMGLEILFTLIVILLFSPIVHDRKNMNSIEIHNYRKISIVIVSVEVLMIMFGMCILKNNIYILAIALGQLSVSLSMIAAKTKEKILKNKRSS